MQPELHYATGQLHQFLLQFSGSLRKHEVAWPEIKGYALSRVCDIHQIKASGLEGPNSLAANASLTTMLKLHRALQDYIAWETSIYHPNETPPQAHRILEPTYYDPQQQQLVPTDNFISPHMGQSPIPDFENGAIDERWHFDDRYEAARQGNPSMRRAMREVAKGLEDLTPFMALGVAFEYGLMTYFDQPDFYGVIARFFQELPPNQILEKFHQGDFDCVLDTMPPIAEWPPENRTEQPYVSQSDSFLILFYFLTQLKWSSLSADEKTAQHQKYTDRLEKYRDILVCLYRDLFTDENQAKPAVECVLEDMYTVLPKSASLIALMAEWEIAATGTEAQRRLWVGSFCDACSYNHLKGRPLQDTNDLSELVGHFLSQSESFAAYADMSVAEWVDRNVEIIFPRAVGAADEVYLEEYLGKTLWALISRQAPRVVVERFLGVNLDVDMGDVLTWVKAYYENNEWAIALHYCLESLIHVEQINLNQLFQCLSVSDSNTVERVFTQLKAREAADEKRNDLPVASKFRFRVQNQGTCSIAEEIVSVLSRLNADLMLYDEKADYQADQKHFRMLLVHALCKGVYFSPGQLSVIRSLKGPNNETGVDGEMLAKKIRDIQFSRYRQKVLTQVKADLKQTTRSFLFGEHDVRPLENPRLCSGASQGFASRGIESAASALIPKAVFVFAEEYYLKEQPEQAIFTDAQQEALTNGVRHVCQAYLESTFNEVKAERHERQEQRNALFAPLFTQQRRDRAWQRSQAKAASDSEKVSAYKSRKKGHKLFNI